MDEAADVCRGERRANQRVHEPRANLQPDHGPSVDFVRERRGQSDSPRVAQQIRREAPQQRDRRAQRDRFDSDQVNRAFSRAADHIDLALEHREGALHPRLATDFFKHPLAEAFRSPRVQLHLRGADQLGGTELGGGVHQAGT